MPWVLLPLDFQSSAKKIRSSELAGISSRHRHGVRVIPDFFQKYPRTFSSPSKLSGVKEAALTIALLLPKNEEANLFSLLYDFQSDCLETPFRAATRRRWQRNISRRITGGVLRPGRNTTTVFFITLDPLCFLCEDWRRATWKGEKSRFWRLISRGSS